MFCACRRNWHQLYIFLAHSLGVVRRVVASSHSSLCLWFLRSVCEALGYSMVRAASCSLEMPIYPLMCGSLISILLKYSWAASSVNCLSRPYTGRAKKWGHRLMTIVLSNLNRFTQIFVHFLRLLAVHWRGTQSAWGINVSQGSVATYARYGGIFNMRLTANLLRYLPVKKFCESVKIWQKYGHESVARLFCYNRINNGLLNM